MQALIVAAGRRYAFNLTVFIASIFGLCLGVPDNYDGILVLTAFVGFGVGGNIPIDTTICLEFLPQVYLSTASVCISPKEMYLASLVAARLSLSLAHWLKFLRVTPKVEF